LRGGEADAEDCEQQAAQDFTAQRANGGDDTPCDRQSLRLRPPPRELRAPIPSSRHAAHAAAMSSV